MTRRTESIRVRVAPAEKAKFENHLEETHEFDSLSRLCRAAVHNHIANQNDDGGDTAAIDSDAIHDLIEDAMVPVTEELEQMNDRLADVEQAVDAADDNYLDDLAHELYHSLLTYNPDKEPTVDFPALESLEEQIRAPETLEDVQRAGTAKAWANFFGEDEQTVRRALARMMEFYPDATCIEDSTGVRRYYKQEGKV